MFRKDPQLQVLEPKSNAFIDLPVTLRWRGTDLPNGAQYVVLVDHAPMRPGQGLLALVDRRCKNTPSTCPDQNYWDGHYIYFTRTDHLVLEALPDLRRQNRTNALDAHNVTIVLIDRTGHRIGEGFYAVEFNVLRAQIGAPGSTEFSRSQRATDG